MMFRGAIPHNQALKYLNRLDIYVTLSRLVSEGFGLLSTYSRLSCSQPCSCFLRGCRQVVVPKNSRLCQN